jgi:uncharacterized protein YaaW (UPF0174 family)
MSIDPLRIAEAGAGAGLALGATALPTAWAALTGPIGAVLFGVWLVLTGAVYALHAVTFDFFRLTGQRRRRIFTYTRSEE